MDALLHVTNGDSTAGTLRDTTLGGSVLAWRDALHVGPIPGGPRPELLRRRAAFLSDSGWGGRDELLSSLEQRDRRLVESLASGTQVVLWFEHDLYDQLQLLDVLTLAREAGVAPEAVVVGSFPGNPAFRGLGELTADELESLWPARSRVPVGALDAAAEIWEDVRRPTPENLSRRVERDAPELPFVRQALLRLLEELPSPGDGLSSTERRTLRALADGARTPVAAFAATLDLEPAPFLGDTWFFASLAELGKGPRRLVETEDGGELPASASAAVRVTRLGEQVLARGADRVELLGIDRWVGGTHVTADAVWRWDAGSRRLLSP